MNDLDKWVAEKIGAKVDNGRRLIEQFGTLPRLSIFSLQDARCRELVREYFRIITYPYYSEKGWTCSAEVIRPIFGKTIAEAEIACIQAIHDSEVSNEQQIQAR